jgi:hypothetical protein
MGLIANRRESERRREEREEERERERMMGLESTTFCMAGSNAPGGAHPAPLLRAYRGPGRRAATERRALPRFTALNEPTKSRFA